jgi:hypothetical protein
MSALPITQINTFINMSSKALTSLVPEKVENPLNSN